MIALALIGGVTFALLLIANLPLQPKYRTHVMITSISYAGSRYSPLTAEISFRSEDGRRSSFSTPPANLNCKVGDTVPAIQQGVTIELTPGACRKIELP